MINQSISLELALHEHCQLRTSAAAIVVNSAFVSYAGATSTISAETMWRPSKPLRMVRNSRVDQPPVSGVPVAGAKAGSIESICEYYERASRKLPNSLANPIHTHIDGEIDGLVANSLANLLDDAIRAYTIMNQDEKMVRPSPHSLSCTAFHVPIVSISRASMRLNPDSSSFT